MSHVMNVMVSYGILEEVDELMSEPLDKRSGAALRKITDAPAYDAWGGTTVPEVDVWAAAFNYVSPEAVLALVASIPWKHPKDVQVFIQDQDDDRFSVHEFRDGVLERVL